MNRLKKWRQLLLMLCILTFGIAPSVLAAPFDLSLQVAYDPPVASRFADGASLNGGITLEQMIWVEYNNSSSEYYRRIVTSFMTVLDFDPQYAVSCGFPPFPACPDNTSTYQGGGSGGGGGGGGRSNVLFEGDSLILDVPILMSFSGTITPTDPCAPPNPFFAYASGAAAPDAAPLLPPVIDLGGLGAGRSISASGPIYAFASPGTQVGTWSAQITSVPEPGTLLLLGSGIAGLAMVRKLRNSRLI